MKRLMKRIRMKQRASKIRSKSVDPLKAYRGHIEIGIYTWLLDLIKKELEAEEKVNTPNEATVTKAIAQAEVQVA